MFSQRFDKRNRINAIPSVTPVFLPALILTH